jgi:RimJ/RimL family protein N-acetyltransferase
MRIQGANVQLRTLAHLDVSKTHLHWKRNSEAAHGTEPQCSEPASQSLRLFAIVANDEGSYVGNIKLGPVSARHGIANILVRIGGETYWEEGIATEAIRLATRYAFSYLSLRRLTASASVRDVLAVRAHEEAGFRVEGVRRGQSLGSGSVEDQAIMGMVAADWIAQLPLTLPIHLTSEEYLAA